MVAGIRYSCDLCRKPLPAGYVPQVDHLGRPCLAVCEPCNRQMVVDRAARLGVNAKPTVIH